LNNNLKIKLRKSHEDQNTGGILKTKKPGSNGRISSMRMECLDCGWMDKFDPNVIGCAQCGSQWIEARYDYAKIGKNLIERLQGRPFDLWRYKELLPIRNRDAALSMGEGGTPLIPAVNLGMMLGCTNIFIKDERQGPTSSFKDRQAAVGVAGLKEAGITEAVLASTGNVAIAYSAYAARAGIKLWAFLTSLVPAEKMREVAIYGTQVIKVTASYDKAKQVAAQFARQRGLYLERGARSIPSVEAMKTVAFEIAEQISAMHAEVTETDLSSLWRTPDWYVQAVSGGLGPYGVQKGFSELMQMGLIDRTPAMANIQTEGCSPMVHAWKQGLETAQPILSPRTHIATLSTGDPGRTFTLLNQRMQATGGGVFESVTDEEAFRAMHILAKMEGISVEPAAAVAFAGLIKLVRAGVIKPDEVIVVNCTGHTMPIEKSILGEGWARNVVIPGKSQTETPQEGLLAALRRVTADRYPRVLIVDDTVDARRLIRRILQAQGEYTIYEASNGQDALQIAQDELPDLIILDLMMPEVDGFKVLDQLKASSETSPIPVIVVTAKELTSSEKQRLEGQIHTLMQKGEFMNDDLMDEVRSLIK
jgi:threonine synthase